MLYTKLAPCFLFYLGELVNPANPLVMSLDEMDVGGNIKEDIFPAAVQAMTVSETTYGYPTLLCGNFITSIGPVTTEKCPINKGVASQSEYQTALETCATNFGNSQEDFKTLLFGKMSDVYGWYLPYLYLDGYIDTKGDSSLEQAVEDLKHGTVDSDVCENLRWFFGLCDNSDTGKNKCKDGTVSSSEVPSSVVDKESVLMFSFSETLAKVLKKADDRNRGPQSLASVSLGNQNLLLQFTDGLVVSRKRWMEHADDKKDAITQFMKFFTSSTFRYKLAYGVDLNKPQVRYLLMPNKDFYEAPSPAAYDPIYSHARKFLSTALPAPLLENKSEIQKVLNDKCLHITVSAKEQNRDSPKRKNEL